MGRMGNTRTNQLSFIGKIILAGIFLVAGIVKVNDLNGFAQSVASFKLVPASLIPAVVATIPFTEIFCAILLFWKRTEGGAATTITLMCIGFTFFYAYAWFLGIEPDCGCFGNNPLLQANPIQGIIRAITIGLLSASVLVVSTKRKR